MAGSIIPIVYGERSAATRNAVLYLHAIGSMAGGALTGGAIGVLGHIAGARPSETGTALLLIGCVLHGVYGLSELNLLSAPSPQSSWQVPRDWLTRWGGRWAAVWFGTALGAGVLTRIVNGSYYVVVYWVLVIGSPIAGAVIMTAFALGRVLPLAVIKGLAPDAERLGEVLDTALRWKVASSLISGLVLLWLGGWIVSAVMIPG